MIMSEAKRWVVVDGDGRMVGGPYVWDGRAVWKPPVDGTLVLEAEWLASQTEQEPGEE